MHIDIFTRERFNNGKWANKLNDALRPDSLRETLGMRDAIAGKMECRHRVWRGTIPYQQWLQYEPEGHDGPFFWGGKPAVMLSGQSLFSGYYVERGLPRGSERAVNKDYVMEDGDPKWDWPRFYSVLKEACAENAAPGDQNSFAGILQSLPEERRCILVCDSTVRFDPTQPRLPAPGVPYPLRTTSALADAKAAIDRIIRDYHDHWIDVVAGVRYTQQECINPQRQKDILEGIVDSLKVGYRLLKDVNPESPY